MAPPIWRRLSATGARRYIEMGATFVAVGIDLGVLRMGTQALNDKFRRPDVAPIAAQY